MVPSYLCLFGQKVGRSVRGHLEDDLFARELSVKGVEAILGKLIVSSFFCKKGEVTGILAGDEFLRFASR